MSNKMLKYTKSLEDSSNLIFGPTYQNLQFWMLIKEKYRNVYYVIHISALLFVVSQYIELWFIREDLELAMRNLSVTMLSTICVFKAGTFTFWVQSWSELIEYTSDLEKMQLSKKDSLTELLITNYVKYSRKLTYFYKVLVTATVTLVILAPVFGFLSSSPDHKVMIKNGSIPYPEILSSWVPFDKTKGPGYWVTILEHSIICCYGGSVVANFDCNAVIIMSFFAGQLNLLRVNCDRLFNNNDVEVTYEKAIQRIKECHYHHLYLVKYSAILNNLLSPVMFLYVVICSLMLCASAIQLTTNSTGNMQRVWIAEYLMALIAQLFLYCWHSNEVLHMSNTVDRGIYSSKWYTQDTRIRRSLLLLGGQLQKSIVFTAGPFTKLNVATFVTILKGSYSYYTLLDKKEG